MGITQFGNDSVIRGEAFKNPIPENAMHLLILDYIQWFGRLLNSLESVELKFSSLHAT